MRTAGLTAAALIGFAANSLLCRMALRPRLLDAATFTSIRIVSGALALLGEALTPRLVACGVIILGGVALAVRGRQKF